MSEPPPEDPRRSRSDAASRLAALLADVGDEAPAEPVRPAGPDDPSPEDAVVAEARRARQRPLVAPPLPDAPADPGPPTAPLEAVVVGADDDEVVDEGEAPVDDDPVADGDGGHADDVEDDDEPAGPPPDPRPAWARRPAPAAAAVAPPASPDDDDVVVAAAADPGEPPVRLRRLTLRAAAFAAAFLVLAAAIPVLGYVGATRLEESRGGQVADGSADPSEPGYRANVAPTPTALVLHRDSEGVPLSATVLALGAGTTGGTVLQVPLTTKVRNQRYYVDKLITAYEAGEDIDLFFREVEDRLGVALQERIDLTDGQLAELVGPVAPLTFDSPDAVITAEGQEFPAGPVTLMAGDVGPYLRGNAGEDELARLVRNEAVWSAWLEAVGEAGEQSVGSGTATGIGPFLRTLASGTQEDPATTRVETLDVGPPLDSPLEVPGLEPGPGFTEQVVDAVPFPLSPRLGRRFSLKLLNGADGTELPDGLLRDLTLAGAALAQLGNADELDQSTTKIEIASRGWRDAAEAARFVLGDSAEISMMSKVRADAEGVDMVITIGSDVLDDLREEDDGG